MTLTILDWLAIVGYFLFLLGFGVIVRQIRSFGDYAVGGRAVPMSMVFASLCATYHGPGYTMGFCAKGFATGWLFFFVVLGFTLQTVLVAFFIAPRLHGFKNCYTIGDVIGTQHGKFAHLISGIISATLCIGFVAVMSKVGALVVQSTLGWPPAVGAFFVTGVGVLYCYTGGIKSVIATEAVQFVISAIAIPMLLWFAIAKGGVDLGAADAKGWASMKSAASGMGGLQIAGLFVSFLLGETLIPPYANRCLAAGSGPIARTGFLGGAAYSVIWFGMVVALGVVAQSVIPEVKADDAFMTLAVKFLPHGLLGLLIVAIIAIIMSSQESVLNAGAVSFTSDIRDVLAGEKLPDAKNVSTSRLATLFMGIVAATLANYAPSVIDGLLIIYAIWAPSVLPVLVLAVLLKNPPRAAAAPAMLSGAAASLIWQYALKEPGQVPSIVVGLGANLLVYWAVGAMSGRRPPLTA